VSSRQSLTKEIDMSKTITITNPWTGALVERDITNLSEWELAQWVELMDDELCEQLSRELAPCTAAEFVTAYVDHAGPDAAGRIILGS
jgi:serine/threonine-protein kinase RIO1